MEIALHIREDGYRQYLTAARWAEENGLAAVAIPDHFWYHPGPDGAPVAAHDALSIAAGLAADTTTIEIVLLVSPVTFRHPGVLAKAAATIDEIAGGRFVLGVGTGWSAEEHQLFGLAFPNRSERFAALEDYLGFLRAAGDPAGPGYDDGSHRLAPGRILPEGPRRLLVGGTGTRRTPALAGRFANEFNAYPAPPDAYRDKLAIARDAAAEAGRDPAALRISTSTVLLGGHDESSYRQRLGRFATRVGADADQTHKGLGERNAPHGTWDQWRAILAQYTGLGVDRLYLQLIGGFDAVVVGEAVEALA